jgi:hypothetical protein
VSDTNAAAQAFHVADVLYALEWAALAPGIGGWGVALDDERATRLVSVTPPGAEQPVFFVSRAGSETVLTWLRPRAAHGVLAEIGRFASLRAAMLALCPLPEEQNEAMNEAMELLYPRSLRTG